MKINNLSEHNCIINRYLAEMRDCDYQKNRLLFRNNIMRIGEYEAFEISKTLNYEKTEVTTPLGVAHGLQLPGVLLDHLLGHTQSLQQYDFHVAMYLLNMIYICAWFSQENSLFFRNM